MTVPAPPPRRRQRWPLWLGGVALLAVLLPAAIWFARLPLATFVLSAALERQGLSPARLPLVSLDLAGARIEGLRLGADEALRADAVTVSWTPSRLLGGRVDHVAIDGLAARLEISGNGGFTVGGVPAGWLMAAGDGAATAASSDLPLSSLDVTIARLDIASPYGALAVAGTAALMTGPDGSMAGEAALTAPRLDGVRATVADISLDLSVTGRPDEPRTLAVSLDGRAASVVADGFDFGAVTLHSSLDDGRLQATAEMKAPAGAATAILDAAPFDPAAAARLTAELHADAAALAALLAPAGTSAAGRIDLAATIDLPQAGQRLAGTLPDGLPAGVAASGALTLALDRLAWPGVGSADGLDGRFDLTGRAAGIEARLAAPATLRNARAEDGLAATLPPEIAALLRSGIDLAIGPVDDNPAVVAFDRAGGRSALAFDGRLAATGRNLDLTLDCKASVVLGDVPVVTASRLRATARALPLSGANWTGEATASDLVTDGTSASAGLAIRLAAGPIAFGEFRARRFALDAKAGVDWRDGWLTVEADGGSQTIVTGLAVGSIAVPGPLALRLAPGAHRLAVEAATGRLDGKLALAAMAAKANPPLDALSIGFAGATLSAEPGGRLATTITRPRIGRGGTGTASAARFEMSAVPVAEGRAVRAGLAGLTFGNGDTPSPQLTVTLDGMVKGQAVAFDLALADRPGSIAFAGKVRHDLASGRGKLTIGKALLDFAPGILQPHDLLPEFAGTGIARLFAVLQGHGTVGWTRAGLAASDLTVALRDGAFAGPVAAGEAFSLDLRLTGLDPPRTPDGQRLGGRLLVGRLEPIPLSATFALAPGPILRVASLDLAVAGGKVSARPFRLNAGTGRARVTFDVDDLDLATLFELIGVKGLTGSGVLAGEIPMTIGPAGAAIVGGRLAARGPGTLSFDVADLPAEIGAREDIVGLVVRTLAGFRYDALSLAIDKEAAGQGKLALRLEGANEAVLDGHPFIFNINLDANFDRLVALAVEGFATADSLLGWAARGGIGTFPDLPEGEN